MKVIKIDIKREEIEMAKDRSNYFVAEIPASISARMAREEEACHIDPVSVTKTRYIIRRVFNPHIDNPKKNYLIKPDDNELFTELLEVSEGLISDRVKRESKELIEEAVEDGIKVGISRGKREIWSLSWYKRLFKITN